MWNGETLRLDPICVLQLAEWSGTANSTERRAGAMFSYAADATKRNGMVMKMAIYSSGEWQQKVGCIQMQSSLIGII